MLHARYSVLSVHTESSTAAVVLFVGAMMSVDSELYEAAMLDGANKWQQFKYIMLPSIKTIVMLNLIMSISGSLSAFEPPYVVMSGGANGTATYFVKMHEIAHTSQKVGLASAYSDPAVGTTTNRTQRPGPAVSYVRVGRFCR